MDSYAKPEKISSGRLCKGKHGGGNVNTGITEAQYTISQSYKPNNSSKI
jgi:hypothetical protein